MSRLFGRARDLRDPRTFHQLSLIAFLAWVGLGADGLSSSAYGPEEAFKALGDHRYLAVVLAGMVAATVFVISWGYRRIIEEFPTGGGGYVVASRHLGPHAGAVSGCALLVDYVLTIAISLASGADAVFSFLPASWHSARLPVIFAVLAAMTVMNLRGIKESVTILTPVFLVFLVSHAVLIGGALITHAGAAAEVVGSVRTDLTRDLHAIGLPAVGMILLRAFSLGGGTFTGIEAVSNGVGIMREPRVRTAKRTMLLMSVSLALTAGGILLAYLLLDVHAVPGKTMNAVLVERFVGHASYGAGFVIITLISEGALLFVAAQAGFVDGPRVMATMAHDQWLPHGMAALSEQLTMKNGVCLMAGASALVLVYTGGAVSTLVVMYSINVFITFTLSNVAMLRKARGGAIAIHGLAAVTCAMILGITLYEKLTEGGWITLAITAAVVLLCVMIRRHYRRIAATVQRLGETLDLRGSQAVDAPATTMFEPAAPTAVVLVGGFGGLGVHTLLQIPRVFPDQFHQIIFVSAGVLDAGSLRGREEVSALETSLAHDLSRYVAFARDHLGWVATAQHGIGTEAAVELERMCRDIASRFPGAVFFAGKLVFERARWYQRLLHNETAAAVERRLQFAGLPMIVMPVRMFDGTGYPRAS